MHIYNLFEEQRNNKYQFLKNIAHNINFYFSCLLANCYKLTIIKITFLLT